ncbi:MAG TPA: hypothetical protein VLN26_02535 [Gaiellaceae bacterium]|nr:hypothetical protein [Gaiellaceae bacterium]
MANDADSSDPMLDPHDVADDEPAGIEAVGAWRLLCLIDAGYPVEVAETLAVSRADLHQACDLVKHGCRPRLALEILT